EGRPDRRDRLGRARGQVPPKGRGPLTRLQLVPDLPDPLWESVGLRLPRLRDPLLDRPVPVRRGPQLPPVGRDIAALAGMQLVAVDLAVEAQRLGRAALPAARRLLHCRPSDVVTLDARANLVVVRDVGDFRAGHHHVDPPETIPETAATAVPAA